MGWGAPSCGAPHRQNRPAGSGAAGKTVIAACARRAEAVTTEAVFKLAADLRGLDATLWSQ